MSYEYFNEFKKGVSEHKEIRDYFLDKPYKKLSKFQVIKKRLKNMWQACMGGSEVIGMIKQLGISALLSIPAYFLPVDTNIWTYMAVSIVVLSSMLFLSRKKNNNKDDLFYISPWLAALFNGLYFMNVEPSALYGSIFVYSLICYPIWFVVIGGVFSFVRNTINVNINPRGRDVVWENLTKEDHNFLSQHLNYEEFVYFLEHFKQYEDLPLSEMIKVRKQELLKNEKEEVWVKKELNDLEKKQKVLDYANTFYHEDER